AKGTSVISVNPLNGFNGSVSLSASGLPSGVTAAFNPGSTTSASTLTLTASSAAPLLTSTITVTGASGALSHSTTVSLTVVPAPNFALAASPNSLSLARGGKITSTIMVTSLNGFTGSVAWSPSGLPRGVTASFNPGSTTNTSTLTLSARNNAATGTFSIRLNGVSGSLSHTVAISLNVHR